jgi:UDP-glucuronate 4-epimerase
MQNRRKILITGVAGFIGYHLTQSCLQIGYEVIGLDNINAYYDVDLKYERLEALGFIKSDLNENTLLQSNKHNALSFIKSDIANSTTLNDIFTVHKFDLVCHLAAQAGVRYSITNPAAYIESNMIGFFNILESCKKNNITKLVFASSSSVYGNNTKLPFSTSDKTDEPVSLYAATKKSNEIMAHSYSKLYGINTIGMRFFTAYGPFGRPDMAYFSFTKAICEGSPIKIFAGGNLKRDFTYIDDIIKGIVKLLQADIIAYKSIIYNIGNNNPVSVNEFVSCLEKALNKTAIKEFLPMQQGDVNATFADIEPLKNEFGYKPNINLAEGLQNFANWYIKFYKVI